MKESQPFLKRIYQNPHQCVVSSSVLANLGQRHTLDYKQTSKGSTLKQKTRKKENNSRIIIASSGERCCFFQTFKMTA